MTTAQLDQTARIQTCPLCHRASERLTDEALASGGSWLCGGCGQHWTTLRLRTVAAYAEWSAAHDAVKAPAAA
jgi:hypothetical protein